jgi:hypothetical protein
MAEASLPPFTNQRASAGGAAGEAGSASTSIADCARARGDHFHRSLLGLRHPWRAWGASAPRPPGIKGSNHPNDQMIDHEPPRTARTK